MGMIADKAVLALTRRKMLAGMAALTTASCCPGGDGDKDVVIIGAGAAGIAAARTLAALGRTCVVIEADSRIGGRAFTDSKTFPLPFDIGCAWIHAGKTNPLYPMALERGYRLHKHDVDTLNKLFYDGKEQDKTVVEAVDGAGKQIVEKAQGIVRAGKDEALAGIMPTCAEPDAAAATFMGPMDAAVDFRDESTTDLTQEEGAEYDPNFLVKEGFGALVADVGKDVRVSLSTAAKAVRYDGKGVTVETGKGTIHAKAAIVTVSTGVLQSGAIKFTPGLPNATEAAIHGLPMGLLTKIPLLVPGVGHYDKDIVPYDNVLNEVAPGSGAPPCSEANGNIYFLAWPWNSDLMVGFVGGSYAWSLAHKRDEDVEQVAIDSLVEIYGSDIAKKVTKKLVTHWGTNPLTLGAYAACVPGHPTARDDLRKPVAQRLFFAGEAVAEDGLFATCGGAYLSGAAQARAVHAALGKA
jgi:monoamine oxidase